MNRLNIYKNSRKEQTVLSNYFIDEFMVEANDAQLKIYLFLIRMMSANLPTSVCDIADKFNYTEKDVLRALMYWESKQLLSLEYDATGSLSGIQVLSLDNPYEFPQTTTRITPVLSFIRPASMQSNPTGSPAGNAMYGMQAPMKSGSAPDSYISTSSVTQFPTEAVKKEPVKPEYSLDDIKQFKNNEHTQQLLFVTEQYIGRQLTRKEMETVLFFYDTLGFSPDLIDYLVQHCVDKGKRDFRYIEKVALAWAEQGITTPKQAQQISKQYDKTVYTIMKSLGKNSIPAPKEMEYINKWTKEYGFLLDVIQEACDKTVMTTDTHRFAYADGILSKWYRAGVHHKSDIPLADASYQRQNNQRATTTSAKAPTQNNRFNRIAQNNYDFEALEQSILSN